MSTKPITITIPTPCHQAWDVMTPEANGRLCNSCRKTVIDFSTWSDAQLVAFFADHSKRNVCGRFLSTQINRPVNIPYQPHSRLYRMTVTLGLVLLFSHTSRLLAQTSPPPPPGLPFTSQTERKEIENIITGQIEGRFIGGSIKDANDNGVAAQIYLYEHNTLVKTIKASRSGGFHIDDILPGTYDILAVYGNDSLRTHGVIVGKWSHSIVHLRFLYNPDPAMFAKGDLNIVVIDEKHARRKKAFKKPKN